MARIRGRDTGPEVRLRTALYKRGLRYRVCVAALPGKPDIVFASRQVAVQVRGCFWHQHAGCKHGRVPASRVEYWGPKLKRTRKRDAVNDAALKAAGWRVLVLWGCELEDGETVEAAADKIARILEKRPARKS